MAMLFPTPLLLIAQASQAVAFWEKMPPMGTMLFGVMAIVGLILWLFGRRLAKPACVMAGLVIGLAAGWFVAELTQADQSLPVYLIAGSLLGGGVCLMLFRLWMGIGLALVLSFTLTPILLPPPSYPPSSPTPPTLPDPQTPSQLIERHRPNAKRLATLQQIVHAATADSPTTYRSSIWTDRSMDMIRQQARQWRDQIKARQTASLGKSGTLAGIVALTGLVIGLLMPKLAASIQSAWAGSWMMLTAARGLIAIHWPNLDLNWLRSPDHWLMALGLITLVGIAVQCSIGRRKTDQDNKPSAG